MVECEKPILSSSCIEKELNQLWQEISNVDSQEKQSDILRSCVFNLVVFAGPQLELGSLSQEIAEITTQHPGRVILVLPPTQDKEPEASVTVLCHPSVQQNQQICCEQIVIQTDKSGTENLTSLITPLLISDLPMVLWWQQNWKQSVERFESIAEMSEHILFDQSGSLFTAPQEIRNILAEWEEWTVTTDLGWERILPWRKAVADAFDLPGNQDALQTLDHLRVWESAPSLGDVASPGRVFASWIATRLKWVARDSSLPLLTASQWGLSNPEGNAIRIEFEEEPESSVSGVCRVRLSGSTSGTVFEIRVSHDGRFLVPLGKSTPKGVQQVFPIGNALDLASLVSRVLDERRQDPIFLDVVEFLSQNGS